jgi:GT2 family glycosyltransferase
MPGLRSLLRELRGFPRFARYTIATRGVSALVADVTLELSHRLSHGSLAVPPAPAFAHDLADAPRLELVPTFEPRASIVIPVFNELARTYACLASIVEHTRDVSFEVIVSDDGSTDDMGQLGSRVGGLRVLRSGERTGFVAACNRGAAAATGRYLVFLNNDTLVSAGWLARLLETFEEEARVGLVGAQLVYPDGRLQEAGGIVYSDGSCWNYGRRDDPQNPKYGRRADVDYCSGACLAIARDLFLEIGGFDSRYAPMYYEDVDLAFAVRAAGWRTLYEPACRIVHVEGGTAGRDAGAGAKRHQRANRLRFASKWTDALARHSPPGRNPDLVRRPHTPRRR